MEEFGNWAYQGRVPNSVPIAKSDKEIIHHFSNGHSMIQLEAGNLCRTLGGKKPTPLTDCSVGTICDVDLGSVRVCGKSVYFASHCSIRKHRFSSKGAFVMNAQWHKTRRVAVRAHPSDGKLDIVFSDLSLSQFWFAVQKSKSGSHVPHPDIRVKKIQDHTLIYPHPMRIYADGVFVGIDSTIELGIAHRAIKVVVH